MNFIDIYRNFNRRATELKYLNGNQIIAANFNFQKLMIRDQKPFNEREFY